MTVHRRVEETKQPSHYTTDGIAHVLDRVRVMKRFFNDVVDENPETRRYLPELHCAYMDILNEEIAPYALDLAITLLAYQERVSASLSHFLARHRAIVRRVRNKKEGSVMRRPR